MMREQVSDFSGVGMHLRRLLSAGVMSLFALCAALHSGTALAQFAVDLNQATRSELESVRGVGVELAERIMQARARQPFSDWADVRKRVKGVGQRALQGFAEAQFTLHGLAPPANQKSE